MITRICAIAKDEAPYIVDWVFHHLYFGFDQIHVYINRTTDSTAEVLDNIAKIYPSVSYEYLDWIDACPIDVTKKMQVIAYAKDLHWARENNVDWWFCLDIDETWVPKKFDISIKDYLSTKSQEHAISFMWHNAFGEDEAFKGVTPESRYFIGKQVKTISPIRNIKIKRVRVHRHKIEADTIVHDANGRPFKFSEENIQVASDDFVGERDAYIVHQMFRSEVEYLNTLARGNPEHEFALKNNRPGYKKGVANLHPVFSWPVSNFEEYNKKKDNFYKTTNTISITKQSREYVFSRSDIVKSKILEMLKKGNADVEKLIAGTSLLK
ncbi:glycosyltransferase family 92 protein [Cobetia marina]